MAHRTHQEPTTIDQLIRKQEELEAKFIEVECEADMAQIDLYEAKLNGARPSEIVKLQTHYDALQRRADRLQEQLSAISEAIWRSDWNGYLSSF